MDSQIESLSLRLERVRERMHQLKRNREEYEESNKKINDQFQRLPIDSGTIVLPKIEKEITRVQAEVKDNERKIESLQRRKLEILSRIQRRYQLINSTNPQQNYQTKQIDREITCFLELAEDLKKKLATLEDEKSYLEQKISKSERSKLEHARWELYRTISGNNDELVHLRVEKYDLRVMLARAKLYEKYVEYAKKWNINYEDLDELFDRCNMHYQNYLTTVNPVLMPGCDSPECIGWYINKKYCECGSKKYEWCDGNFIPDDIISFNLESPQPFGYKEDDEFI